MSISKPIAVLGALCLLLASAAALAQNGGASPRTDTSAVETVVLAELKNVDWIEKSEVAALREGVIERMELKVGMTVKKGGTIGTLHHEIAELTVAKNKLQAEVNAPTQKAEAQKAVAASVVARNIRLNARKPGMVSDEDVAKAEGELRVAEAQLIEARENRAIAEAELNLAKETLKEHTIVAPFDGVVIRRMKNPGESVRANEAVVVLGNPAKLCVDPYLPLEYAYRVKVGQVVEIQPKITSGRGGGQPLPIERKHFRGKITFVDPAIQPVAEEAVRVRAEFDNPDLELRAGLMVQVTIFLTPDVANSTQGNEATRTARAH